MLCWFCGCTSVGCAWRWRFGICTTATLTAGVERRPGSATMYNRDELLALRPEPKTTNTSHHVYLPVLKNIPAELIRSRRRRKRGKKGGKESRLWRRSTRPPLPFIVLANVRAIHIKIGTIRTYARYSHDLREALLLCFTETWPKPTKLDSSPTKPIVADNEFVTVNTFE